MRRPHLVVLAGLLAGLGCASTRPAAEVGPAKGKATEGRPARRSARVPPAKQPSRPVEPAPDDVERTVEHLAPTVEERLQNLFARAGAAYPPKSVTLLAFKAERTLELWAESDGTPMRVWVYRLLDSSPPGPKLEEGDWQIPEGVYRVTHLNPRSEYHLSLGLDYPNDFDRAMAANDRRTTLGGDIFIHGGDVSIGCLAIGDAGVEELFVLAARIGVGRMRVLIAPADLRTKPAPAPKVPVAWLDQLYALLKRELSRYPAAGGGVPAAAVSGRGWHRVAAYLGIPPRPRSAATPGSVASSAASAAAAATMPAKKSRER